MRNPYIAGPFVTGSKHYGRLATLDYLLHGASPAYWVVGGRRIGKTSLLRQLELLAGTGGQVLPLFWDLQGCDNFKQLGQYLADAVNDCREQLIGLGLAESALAHEDVLVLLPRLRRAAQKAGREVLLLCDEAEVLVKIAVNAPRSLQRLHALLTGGNGLRVVVTSTPASYALHDVCRDWPTSSFLAGFDMSQTLGSLLPRDTRRLILQAQEPEPVRAVHDVIEAIARYTNDHPYLTQLLCARLFEDNGRLRSPTSDDLVVDPGLAGFLAVDFGLLAQADRRLILAVADDPGTDEDGLARALEALAPEIGQRVRNLARLGCLRRAGGGLALGNHFLVQWLAQQGDRSALLAARPASPSEGAMRAALDGQQAQDAHFLRTQLNAHRARLVELEAIRARDLLQVSPQILAEIEQHQYHIRHLVQSAGD